MRLTQARRRLLNDLIRIRVSQRISQAQVARALGINRSGISRFESDIEGSKRPLERLVVRTRTCLHHSPSGCRRLPGDDPERRPPRTAERRGGS
ncbi:helix-turn-helix domain-containing protein [Nocardia callitridis]|uniref:helix-turn-helix domain-containing protein n=1 Tax=Nocardia callitridis TaxID=648753 RepID=UPI003CD0B75A